jgi:hypothetical protein
LINNTLEEDSRTSRSQDQLAYQPEFPVRALTEVVTQARDLRKRISSGLVSEKDLREALGDLRKRRAKLVARTASIKTMYEGALKTIEDPAARVAALKNKYPALRR